MLTFVLVSVGWGHSKFIIKVNCRSNVVLRNAASPSAQDPAQCSSGAINVVSTHWYQFFFFNLCLHKHLFILKSIYLKMWNYQENLSILVLEGFHLCKTICPVPKKRKGTTVLSREPDAKLGNAWAKLYKTANQSISLRFNFPQLQFLQRQLSGNQEVSPS